MAIIEDISDDPKFIESMIKLHETDIIEYNLKISQFRNQAQQQQESSIRNNTIPHCPTCGSTNIKPIGSGERTLSVAAFGLLSKKINKSYKCLNCKYTW